jgi:hypothetical protein
MDGVVFLGATIENRMPKEQLTLREMMMIETKPRRRLGRKTWMAGTKPGHDEQLGSLICRSGCF